MNTIEELKYYCNEIEPVGALLLTGEWGCGKTYLIEHELKDELKGMAVILRVSLFGITSLEQIHDAVRTAWLDGWCEVNNIDAVTEKLKILKGVISKLAFIPEEARSIASTDVSQFVPMNQKMGEKTVVLVFDDLERCNLNILDVLGAINEYCENKKIHTIIVANQEKIKKEENLLLVTAEVQFSSSEKVKYNLDGQATKIKISEEQNSNDNEISYREIKEKIIQRTVSYIPEYSKLIDSVIENMKYQDNEYKVFIQGNRTDLLDLFVSEDFENSEESKGRPHNIRSLKCAISDFYRVYKIMKKYEMDDIEDWLYAFVAYVIANKADIAKEGKCGKLFIDTKIQKVYPTYQNQHMLDSIEAWILHGIWNEDAVIHEIEMKKKRAEAIKPSEIIKMSRIMNIDEDVVEKGLDEFLNMAYGGNLTLDEYVLLIQNSAWARCDVYYFADLIDWSKVEEGIKKQMDKLKKQLSEDQLIYSIINEDKLQNYTLEEQMCYRLIYDFARGTSFMFYRNHTLYINRVREDGAAAFSSLENKRFDVFDEEMASVTAQAFLEEKTVRKGGFYQSFYQMWNSTLRASDIKPKECLEGLKELEKLLKKQIESMGGEGSKRTYALIHTEKFIGKVQELKKVCGGNLSG